MIIDETIYLEHYGTPRHSGRYPWGSGGDPEQSAGGFDLDLVNRLHKDGFSDAEISESLNMTTTELRAKRTIANNARKREQIAEAEKLKEKDLSNSAIGRLMDLNESSVRALLAPGAKEKADALLQTAEMIKEQVAIHKYVDIGKGVENHIKISKERLRSAVAILVEQGYKVYYGRVPQLTGQGTYTTSKYLGGPDSTRQDAYENRFNYKVMTSISDNYGKTYSGDLGQVPSISINPKRLAINYAEDGGSNADGVIYLRPNVSDLSMNNKRYAQVRILVDNTHYLKGMAFYKDDLPDGVDLVFNTNKSNTGNKLDALKKITDDPANPFGAVVKQLREVNSDGTRGKAISAVNIVNEEGDWDKWSRNLSTQVLSKQTPSLAKGQLDVTYENRIAEYNSILEMTNPTVRRKLLKEFSDGTDSASVHLKAASLPRQSTKVILPINSLPENQIYAPSYRDGEVVALVRYPHGGTFEIPELTVNNRHRESKKILGDTVDAVGINARVAERLSGADFDGDTVLVIPNSGAKRLTTTPALEGLKNFNPREKYAQYDGMKVISEKHMQKEMGNVSNLITDMTIRKAPPSEIVRAVRHSMVVIDSYKHKLDYKQSAIDNNISQLKEKYQKPFQEEGKSGASTLISRATSEVRVPMSTPRKAQAGGPIDKATGKLVFTPTGESYVDKSGNVVVRTKTSQRLKETDDARTLSSNTPIERVYADHSNRLKALANKARLDMVNTPLLERSPSAAKTYANEVKQLDSKLTLALQNSPLERRAQAVGNALYIAKLKDNPDMDNTQKKRIKAQLLEEARIRVGAKKEKIVIEPKQWDAIQAGAISDTKLTAILDNADMDVVRKLATPKTVVAMTSAKTRRAENMLNLGYTRAEVADALGVSTSTLDVAIAN